MDKPQVICHVEKGLDYTLFDCKWVPKTAKFTVVGSRPKGTGVIEMFEISSNEMTSVKKIETPASIKCSSYGASPFAAKHLATGNFNGEMQIWDMETSKIIYDVKGHDEIINAIDAIGGIGCGSQEIATGSRDGRVKVWDIREKHKPVAVIETSQDSAKRDCWTVCFGNSYNNEERMLVAGYDNGDVKLFDLREMKAIWEKNVKNGVCSVEFDRKDIPVNKLLVTTIEAKFHVFELRTLHPIKGYTGLTEKAHKATIWLGRHCPQNRDIFMTAGGSGSLCLWKYNYPENRSMKDVTDGKEVGVVGSVDLLQNMTLSTQPLASFDWCPEKLGLAVCTSFDQVLRLVIVTKLVNY